MGFLHQTPLFHANNLPYDANHVYMFLYNTPNKKDINGNRIIKARFFIIEMENGIAELVDYTRTITNLAFGKILIIADVVYCNVQYDSLRVFEYDINRHLKDLKVNKMVRVSIR